VDGTIKTLKLNEDAFDEFKMPLGRSRKSIIKVAAEEEELKDESQLMDGKYYPVMLLLFHCRVV